MTLEYVQTRQAFKRPIGAFQALQHRMADMLLRTESTRSAVYRAAWCLDTDDADAALACAAAKAYAGDAARLVCGEAIQMHGGIGFTWELDLHFYFKRAKTLEQHYGSTEAQLEHGARRGRVLTAGHPRVAATSALGRRRVDAPRCVRGRGASYPLSAVPRRAAEESPAGFAASEPRPRRDESSGARRSASRWRSLWHPRLTLGTRRRAARRALGMRSSSRLYVLIAGVAGTRRPPTLSRPGSY